MEGALGDEKRSSGEAKRTIETRTMRRALRRDNQKERDPNLKAWLVMSFLYVIGSYI